MKNNRNVRRGIRPEIYILENPETGPEKKKKVKCNVNEIIF